MAPPLSASLITMFWFLERLCKACDSFSVKFGSCRSFFLYLTTSVVITLMNVSRAADFPLGGFQPVGVLNGSFVVELFLVFC